MELWFTEHLSKHARFSLRVNRHLYSGQSPYQKIDVFDTAEFGRVLVLDGFINVTERDEFIYHEMITHVPMAVHPDPRRVLVVGGGDGGTVRELCRYERVEHIDMVEIDELVVKVAKEHFPATSGALSDPRVNLHFSDGVDYVKSCSARYDLIIVDSTDPVGPGEGLFTSDFYRNCFRILNDDGIMVNQHEGPFYEEDARACQRAHARIVEVFPISRVYQANIPTCIRALALWLCLEKCHPVKDLRPRPGELGLKTRYYNTALHKAAFVLPVYVEGLLAEVER